MSALFLGALATVFLLPMVTLLGFGVDRFGFVREDRFLNRGGASGHSAGG